MSDDIYEQKLSRWNALFEINRLIFEGGTVENDLNAFMGEYPDFDVNIPLQKTFYENALNMCAACLKLELTKRLLELGAKWSDIKVSEEYLKIRTPLECLGEENKSFFPYGYKRQIEDGNAEETNKRKEDIAIMLIESHGKIRRSFEDYEEPSPYDLFLFRTVFDGMLKTTRKLLSYGANPNQREHFINTTGITSRLLFRLVDDDVHVNSDMLALLLEYGANPFLKNHLNPDDEVEFTRFNTLIAEYADAHRFDFLITISELDIDFGKAGGVIACFLDILRLDGYDLTGEWGMAKFILREVHDYEYEKYKEQYEDLSDHPDCAPYVDMCLSLLRTDMDLNIIKEITHTLCARIRVDGIIEE